MHLAFQSLEKDEQPIRITLHSEKGQVTIMGLVLFVLLSSLEIILVVKGHNREKWLRNRLLVYVVELAIVLIAFMLPYGQKWRLVPVLGFLMVLGIVALLKWLIGSRRKDNIEKKMGSIIVGCVFSVIFIGLFLVRTSICDCDR